MERGVWMDKILFNNKYRIESVRLTLWDYSSPAHYFVTICVSNKFPYFGSVVDGIMRLNKSGEAAQRCWDAVPKHFPHAASDASIIMPDHVHGIIVIKHRPADNRDYAVGLFGPQSKNLGSIVRGFKIGVTKWARENDCDFFWQPRFYDNVIRDETALNNIRAYIANNPVKWEYDRGRDVSWMSP